ncbi:MAG: alpha/beta hydrolase, partial [Candidatus Saccharimonadales bacterium]
MAFASDEDFRRWLRDLEISYERLFYGTDWKPWLAEKLPGYDVLQPTMPNKSNAKYPEWSIYFSKIVTFLRPGAVLIGHSLGAIFLAKYLSEHPPVQKFSKVILVAAPYNDEATEPLGDFKLASAKGLADATEEIHLFYSRDDPVVSFDEMSKYQRDLPAAKSHIFDGRGHFNTPDFPE